MFSILNTLFQPLSLTRSFHYLYYVLPSFLGHLGLLQASMGSLFEL
jgi:hypothetical protein